MANDKLVPVTLMKLKDGWHSDGNNLYLFIRGGSRSWVFRYVGLDGKRKNMGLGALPSVSLAVARKEAAKLREELKHPLEPIDPLAARKQRQVNNKLTARKLMTFKNCALAYIEAHRTEWRSSKHVQQWENTLSGYAYPIFGDLPVSMVDDGLVLKVLMPIWGEKTETAKRLRGRIESVLDWATFSKFRSGENPARWKGHLENSLAKPSKISKVKHHAALPYIELGAFMVDLRKCAGVGARALEFAILTAARSGEVRGATWDEFDLAGRIWSIPAERMKAEKDHRVPLSDAVIALLKALPNQDDSALVFPSSKAGVPLSDMTLTAVLRRMGRGAVTAHGFRSTFRDWTAETTSYPHEMAEMALAHSVGNKVEAAYRRGDMLEKRLRMMQEWATYCGAIHTSSAKITPIRSAA